MVCISFRPVLDSFLYSLGTLEPIDNYSPARLDTSLTFATGEKTFIFIFHLISILEFMFYFSLDFNT